MMIDGVPGMRACEKVRPLILSGKSTQQRGGDRSTEGAGRKHQLSYGQGTHATHLRQPPFAVVGCQALQARQYGVGWLCAAIMWAEIGDARRFTSSDQLVRYAGLDVTVYSSDTKRSPGHLSRQGSPELRWAAFEAAKCAARPGSPDYGYYRKLAAKRDGHNGKNPTLAVERKILRRCYHTLRELGDAALALPDIRPQEVAA